jgi:hypothetical protein
MRPGTRRCPVCWQTALPTSKGTVYRHWDSIGNTVCPMSGERYDMAESGRRVKHLSIVAAAS